MNVAGAPAPQLLMSSVAISTGPTRANRGLFIALALSLAAHVLLLTLTPRPRYDAMGPMSEQEPMRVEIVQQPPAAIIAPPVPQPVEKPQPVHKAIAHPAVRPPPVRRSVPQPEAIPEPAPVREPRIAARPPPTFDMSAMIAARRAQRLAAEEALERRDEAPSPPPVDEGLASLNRNLQTLTGREGIGGVFTILHMGVRTGEFAFNGWGGDTRRQWREVIEVDAGPNGNLQLAMIRRMIALIREHYTGDFNWQSYRLQRIVILSARPEDNAELEDFLMREFFGTPLLKPAG